MKKEVKNKRYSKEYKKSDQNKQSFMGIPQNIKLGNMEAFKYLVNDKDKIISKKSVKIDPLFL